MLSKYINREADKEIQRWYETRYQVLHVTGMRQVGKTRLVTNFLIEKKYKYINLWESNEIGSMFEQGVITMDNYLKILDIDKETIIVFDEIQKSPSAYNWIKTYKDEMVRLKQPVNIIMLGSYAQVTIETNEEFAVNTGVIKELKIFPLSFMEFVNAQEGGESLIVIIEACIQKKKEIPSPTHYKMKELFKTYLMYGGLPHIVSLYLSTEDLEKDPIVLREINEYLDLRVKEQIRDIQRNHLTDKKHKKVYRERIVQLYKSIVKGYIDSPNISGEKINKFKYIYIDDKKPYADKYKEVLSHLLQGNILTKIEAKGFKLIYSDLGVANNQISNSELWSGDSLKLGSIYESFVAQEIRVYTKKDPSYWYHSDGKHKWEIDFIHNKYLLEVKSGKRRFTTKSLNKYVSLGGETNRCIILHNKNINSDGKYLKVPIYATWALIKYL